MTQQHYYRMKVTMKDTIEDTTKQTHELIVAGEHALEAIQQGLLHSLDLPSLEDVQGIQVEQLEPLYLHQGSKHCFPVIVKR
jgi:hypothetical protein